MKGAIDLKGKDNEQQIEVHSLWYKLPLTQIKLLVWSLDTFGLEHSSLETTNHNSEKEILSIEPTNKKNCYTTLGTSVIYSPMSPLSLSGKRKK